MNILNRLLLAALLLAIAGTAIGVIVLAWTIPEESTAWLRDAAGWLDENNSDADKSLLTLVAGLLALFCLLLMIVELRPRAATDVKVTDLHVGDAVLSTAAIGQRVEEAVSLVPQVADARATIKAKRKGVLVMLDLHVDPGANLASVTNEACQAASDVLTNQVHVALAEPPRARLHYRELRLGRGEKRPTTTVEQPAAVAAPTLVETPLPASAVATPPEAQMMAAGEGTASASGRVSRTAAKATKEPEEVAAGERKLEEV